MARYVSCHDDECRNSINPEGSIIELNGNELGVTIDDFYRRRIYHAVFKVRYCPICGKEININSATEGGR